MAMPTPRSTVRRSSRLLIRMGLTRTDALRTIMVVCAHGLVRLGDLGSETDWIGLVQAEAYRQLVAHLGHRLSTDGSDTDHASTTTDGPGSAGPGPA